MAKPKPARGQRLDGVVRVADEAAANRIFQRSFIGTLGPGNALTLSDVEAAWLVTQERLAVDGQTVASLLRAAGRAAEVGFLAYADLRDRGLVVRHDGDAFAVWPRGHGPPAPPQFRLHVRAEREPVPAATLQAWAAAGDLVAVVDEDGAVTHYRMAPESPAGNVPVGELPACEAFPMTDRVLVADGGPLQAAFLGTPTGAGLVLSFTEAEWLHGRGVLAHSVAAAARKAQPDFDLVLAAYSRLRAAGLVVKSGFKFGTHLRAYTDDPDRTHAQFLVHCHAPGSSHAWVELSRAVRLAHGVRKRFLLAVVGDEVAFVGFEWFRP
ncbi:MAG: tRNA-intron endonuclease, archaea type [Thermoplasmata archaeon]|jgi:tRNA-intron endonuclease|nr:tRNA-intron endonuclease, archaea type [Thermoplasmata archaeon]